MAKLGWIGSVALATGAAAGAAAAQFGLGYGLGIISWAPDASGPGTPDAVWLSSLAWTVWIAASSTVFGAYAADRRSAGDYGAAPPKSRPGAVEPEPPTLTATAIWRALLAAAAAVGALLSVALVLVPARVAVRADTSTPELTAAAYAVIGIVAGMFLAAWALAARAAAANAIASAAWIWALAVGSVIDAVVVGRTLGTAPLDEWPFDDGAYLRGTWSIPGAVLMLGSAFVIGALAAWPSARRGEHRLGAQFSGAFGPILIVAGYSLTMPRLVGLDDPLVSAFLVAPFAPITGLAGAVLVAALVGRRSPLAAGRRERGRDASAEAEPIRIPTTTSSKRGRGRASVPAQPGPAAGVGSAGIGSAGDVTTEVVPGRLSTPPLVPSGPSTPVTGTVGTSAGKSGTNAGKSGTNAGTSGAGTGTSGASTPVSSEKSNDDVTLRIRPNRDKRRKGQS